MAASGQNRSSRQPCNAGLRPAGPRRQSQRVRRPGRDGSARVGVLCQARPPGIGSRTNTATRRCARLRIAWPWTSSPSTLAPRLAPRLLPNDHLKLTTRRWPAKTGGRRWVRTTGPSLVRRLISVAGRGWASPYGQLTSNDCGWTWPGMCTSFMSVLETPPAEDPGQIDRRP